MAYCKSCGAYIPDGVTACIACGYDEAAEQQKTSARSTGSAAARASEKKSGREKYKQFDSDYLREQLEEQRKRQQANSRKWAETEYAQRQKAKQEQERNFSSTSGRSGSDVYQSVRSAMNSKDGSKIFAGLSYFSVLFLLPYLFRGDDEFAKYHAKQGMGLFIAGLIGQIVGGIFHVGWLVNLARFYFIYKGVDNVVKDKEEPLPYIGDIIK